MEKWKRHPMCRFFLLISLVCWFSQSAFAECGFRKEKDQKTILVGPGLSYMGIRSYSHFDDGPGYNHYRGLLSLLDSSGNSLADFTVNYDDLMEDSANAGTAQIEVKCPELKKDISEAVRSKMAAFCKSPFSSSHLKNNPKTIHFIMDQLVKILELKPGPSESCPTQFQVKVEPASNEYLGEPVKQKSGLWQLLTKDKELKTDLSLIRKSLPPNRNLNSSVLGCKVINQKELVVIDNYSYIFCLGEGESSFQVVPVSKTWYASAKHNVLGLRALKKKSTKEAETQFKTAIELNPRNELANYNLASVMAAGKNNKEIKLNLKRFVDLSIENALRRPTQGPDDLDPIVLLKEELKSKILKDSDLKNIDPIILKEIFQ